MSFFQEGKKGKEEDKLVPRKNKQKNMKQQDTQSQKKILQH